MRLTRRQVAAYVALVAVVAAVGVRYLILDEGAVPAGEQLVLAPAPSPSGPPPEAVGGAASAGARAEVVVHVCGAVRSPGVVRLPEGSRVADALEFAGGATGRANLSGVNLAARVADGQQILVPESGRSGAAGGGPATAGAAGGDGVAPGGAPTGALVNVNTATAAELETLPGVGPATAQKIVDYRTTHGGFKAIDELKNVPGIGDAKFSAVEDAITI